MIRGTRVTIRPAMDSSGISQLRAGTSRTQVIWALAVACLLSATLPGYAADRRFAVILANPKKTFGGAAPPLGFANPDDVKAQYFDTNPNNDIYSFAEYWKEVSYGAVTVTGNVFGWIQLPWPIEPPDEDSSPANFINLNQAGNYQYGAGEPFIESPRPAPCTDGYCGSQNIAVDFNGDGPDSPFLGQPNDVSGVGGGCEGCCTLDDNMVRTGACQGFDEGGACGASSEVNPPCGPGNCCMPYDSDGDFIPDCIPVCVQFPCPDGSISPRECTARFGTNVQNGELCFAPCTACSEASEDRNRLTLTDGPNIPSLPLADGVFTPGERFRDVYDDGRYNAMHEPLALDNTDPENSCNPEMGEDAPHQEIDRDNDRDIPEPFEDFLVQWDPEELSGQGGWRQVTQEYIYSNYPLNPNWHLIEYNGVCDSGGALWDNGLGCVQAGQCLDGPNLIRGCEYFRCEMLRLRRFPDNHPDPSVKDANGHGRPLATLNQAGACTEDATLISKWTNVDEMAWRTGNGVYDPADRFRNTEAGVGPDNASTKMVQMSNEDDDNWVHTVYPPGNYPDSNLDTEDWYADFWLARYGTTAPAWAKGNASDNSPHMVVFDPALPSPHNDDEDFPGSRRFLANAGRPDLVAEGEETLDGVIRPDFSGAYYDGWVEHDDLASSRYHAFGDQRFGEVTSPNSDAIWGFDEGRHRIPANPLHDSTVPAAGPLAKHIHGAQGADGGDVMVLEWNTWRTDIPYLPPNFLSNPAVGPDGARMFGWTPAVVWEREGEIMARTRIPHPYAGPTSGFGADVTGDGVPDGYGFRDYNLDGMVDQGEIRPANSANYTVDPWSGTSNDGTFSDYPFNRRRLWEDCVEVLDRSVDFDLYRDLNSLNAVYKYATVDGFSPGVREGLVSGMVLLPPGALTNPFDQFDFSLPDRPTPLFPNSNSYYPIHTEDRDVGGDPNVNYNATSPQFKFHWQQGTAAVIGDIAAPDDLYNHTLWFSDLVTSMDRGWPCDAGGQCEPYQLFYTAQQYGLMWEHYADLFDLERLRENPVNERFPIGRWGLMADGDVLTNHPVHPVADFKSEYSEWVDAINLITVLSPGIEREITIGDSEVSNNSTYYYYENPIAAAPGVADERFEIPRERFYFWRAGFNGSGLFGQFLPWQGLLIMHTNVVANAEGLPPQQSDPFTWTMLQADGDNDLDGGVNLGDPGDPFPGVFGTTQWSYDTFPDAHSRWQGDAFSGIEIRDIVESQGGTRVKFLWTPVRVPSLTFVNPPGGTSVGNLFKINYNAYDRFAGTTIEFYYDSNLNTRYDGTKIPGSATKSTPLILEPGSFNWYLTQNGTANGTPLPNGLYYLYAKLNPGAGVDGGVEAGVSEALPSRSNVGNGTLTSPSDANKPPNVNLNVSKLEAWTVTCISVNGQTWEVKGSVSGIQTLNAFAGQTFTSAGGEVSFLIRPGTKAFTLDDQFIFVTTGKTPYSQPVNVIDGKVTNAPIARIIASPVAGDPPLAVHFDGRSSDNNGAVDPMFSWNFGDGEFGDGDETDHTYEEPGTYAAVLTVTDPLTNAFGIAQVEIRVNNGKPTADIVAVPQNANSAFPYQVLFIGSGSTDPEELPLTYFWDFDDRRGSTSTLADPPIHTYFADPDNPGPYCADVKLVVTDSADEDDLATVRVCPGNTPPTASFTAAPTVGESPLTVQFNASASSDPDAGQTLTYVWNFDDPASGAANTSTAVSPSHRFNTAGNYSVVLTVSDGMQSDEFTREIRVVDEGTLPQTPEAVASASPTSGQVPLLVNFSAAESSDPQGDPLTYEWTFGDGGSANGVEVAHLYQSTGTFVAKLTVVDSENHESSDTVSIQVVAQGGGPGANNQAPVADFSADPMSGAAPLAVAFTALSTDANGDTLSHQWDFGDGQSDDGDLVNHTFNQPGQYEVVLTATDPQGLSDTSTRLIEVFPAGNRPPVARFATIPTDVVAPGQMTLDANLSMDEDGDALVYIWTISSGGVPIVFPNEIAGARVILRYRNAGGCADTPDPCVEPGSYSIDVSVDDGLGGFDISDPRTITVVQGQEQVDEEEPGSSPDDLDGGTLSGSARLAPATGCATGMLMPMMASMAALASLRVVRRRRW